MQNSLQTESLIPLNGKKDGRGTVWSAVAAGGLDSWSVAVGDHRVFVGSVPLLRDRAKGIDSLPGLQAIKEQLASHLWKEALYEGTLPSDRPPICSHSPRLSLTRDALGKPLVVGPESLDVRLSFSYGKDRLWAALARSPRHLGLDVAHPAEFQGSYPFHQAFHDEEWLMVPDTSRQSSSEAAAFLWSLKEAAVKSLGCGFHFLGPKELLVAPWEMGTEGKDFRVWIRPFDAHRARALCEVEIHATSRRVGDARLALALCDRGAAEALGQTTLPGNERLP